MHKYRAPVPKLETGEKQRAWQLLPSAKHTHINSCWKHTLLSSDNIRSPCQSPKLQARAVHTLFSASNVRVVAANAGRQGQMAILMTQPGTATWTTPRNSTTAMCHRDQLCRLTKQILMWKAAPEHLNWADQCQKPKRIMSHDVMLNVTHALNAALAVQMSSSQQVISMLCCLCHLFY